MSEKYQQNPVNNTADDSNNNSYRRSQDFQKYQYFFKDLTSLSEIVNNTKTNITSSLISLLEAEQIQVNMLQFSPFSIAIASFSPTCEIVKVKLTWGYYSMVASVLNIKGKSIFHSCRFSNGSNANVYHIQQQHFSFSIKCIETYQHKQQFKIIGKKKAFQEYFLSRIASALGCGPILTKPIGFDLIFSQDCIQFALQHCENVKFLSGQGIIRMKQALLKLHNMHIIHFDIKPDNIMWSNHFKSEVFIDYGLSQIVPIDAGIKYSTTFRGSPNYCSSEMSALLSFSARMFIDIHYNDVYCLQQSFRIFKCYSNVQVPQQLLFSNFNYKAQSFEDSKIQNQKPKHERKENLSLYLINVFLKYLLHTKNLKEVDKIYHQSCQKALIFSRDILQFVRNNYESLHIKQFYQKYVDDSIRDSVQFEWINRWSKSVYPKTISISEEQMENKSFFLSFYEELSNSSETNTEDLNLGQLEQILFETKLVEDYQKYFQCFVAYISFVNNTNQLNTCDKLKAARSFIKLILPQNQNNMINDKTCEEQIFFQLLTLINKNILNYYSTQRYKTRSTCLKNTQRIQLILQVIEHIFLFSLFKTEEIIPLLTEIYEIDEWQNIIKLQFIIGIINLNDWNLVQLFEKQSIQYLKIQEWFRITCQKFASRKLQKNVAYIFNIFNQSQIHFDIDLLLQQKQFIGLSSSFKVQFWLSQLPKYLMMIEHPIQKICKFIESNFPPSQQRRAFPLHFHIYSKFILKYHSLQQCWSICLLFKNNLNSDYLYDRLLFVKTLKIHCQQSYLQKMKGIAYIASLVRFQNCTFAAFLLIQQIQILKFQLIGISMFRRQIAFIEMIQQIQRAISFLDFRKVLETSLSKCQFKDNIYFYFALKQYACYFQQKPLLEVHQQINELQEFMNNNQCSVCKICMLIELVSLKQIQAMKLERCEAIKQIKQLFQFIHTYQLSNKPDKQNGQFYSTYRIFKMYSVFICRFLDLKCLDSQFYQMVYRFYMFCKAKDLIEKFIYLRFIQQTLSAICYLGSIQQLVFFIRETFKFLLCSQNIVVIDKFSKYYQNFILKCLLKHFPEAFSQFLSILCQQESSNPYVAVFYYSCIPIQALAEYRYYFVKKILRLIQQMSAQIMAYFQSLVYLNILYADNQQILKLFYHQQEHKQVQNIARIICKKVSRLIKKLIKNIMLYSFIPNCTLLKPSKTKYMKYVRSRERRALLQKWQCIASYRLQDYSSTKLIAPISL